MRSRSRRAFTLVELLIVIVVIGILIAIVVPSFIGVRDNARDSASKSAVTVAYHNAKALWAQSEAFPTSETQLVDALTTAEPGFVFQTATPTSGDPEDLFVDLDSIAGDDDITICSESGSGTWFCLRADESGTHFVQAPIASPASLLAAAGDTIAKSRGVTLEDALCYLPTDTESAGTGCTPGSGAPSWEGGGLSESEAPEAEDAPVNLALPTVIGAMSEGETLTSTNGGWSNTPTGYTYQWQRSDNGTSGWTNISAATSGSYTLVAGDVGTYVRIRVTASNAGGSASAESAAAGPVASGAPVNVTTPAITGTLQQGATISVDDGAWSNGVASYAYQWQRDTGSGFSDIPGATASTYVLTAADVNADITAIVTATNAYGSTAATAAPVGPVLPAAPTIDIAPAITGSLLQGETLSASTGTWMHNPTGYAYQWQRDTGSGFANISGATSSTYTLVGADVDATIRVRVTATNAGGSTQANSAGAGPVIGIPSNTSAPSISGSPVVGQVLTVSTGTWSGSPTSYTYQWQRDTGSGYTNISGATSDAYTVGGTALGGTIRVRVSATNAAGTGGPVSSNEVGPVEGAPVNTAVPVASGTANAGETLTASNGSWNGAPTSYAYQWQYSGDGSTAWTNITGATSDTYVIEAEYLLKYVRVRVTAANAHGSTQAYSAARGPVDITDPIVNGDFEGGTYNKGNGFLTPTGWDSNSGGSGAGVDTSPAGTNGSTHLYTFTVNAAGRNRFTSNEFTVQGGKLYFDVRGYNSTPGTARFRVRIMSPSDVQIYSTGDLNTATNTAWVTRTVDLTPYVGQTVKVELSGNSQTGAGTNGARFDNVRVLAQ